MGMPRVRKLRGAVVLTAQGGRLARFTAKSVAMRPWPMSPVLTAAIRLMYDDLIDAGVSPGHPFLLDCPDCGAEWATPCTHKRRGTVIGRWHKGRKL